MTEEYVQYALVEKLKDVENYKLWQFQVKVLFKSVGATGIVEGNWTEPGSDAAEADRKEWALKDGKAQRIIMSTVDKSLLPHLLDCKNSSEMYKKYVEMFENKGDERKCILMQDFLNFQISRGESVAAFLSKISNHFASLKAVEPNLTDDLLINKIIISLPEKYNPFVTAWRLNGNRKLSDLIANLISEEQRTKESTSNEQVAFMSSSRDIVCFRCHEKGHVSRFCDQNKPNSQRTGMKNDQGNQSNNLSKGRQRKFCTICKKKSHYASQCNFRPGGKWDPNKSDTDKTQQEEKVSFLVENSKSGDIFEWVLDSGSSSHITFDKNALQEIVPVNTEIGVAKRGSALKIRQQGKIETDKCLLRNVLYSPDITRNLLSVNAIVENGGEVLFNEDGAKVYIKGELIFEAVRQGNGLFTVALSVLNKNEALLTQGSKALFWHNKLGHLGITNMKKLISMSDGFKIGIKELEQDLKNCDVCLKTKMTRKTFGPGRESATRPLQIIHSDVGGKVSPMTWDGKQYYVTFRDDFTGYIEVYLLAAKSEVFEVMRDYVAAVEAKWGTKIHKIRVDNGGEYSSNAIKQWWKTRGIVPDFTPPYTPQLNGTSERLNRTLMDKTRALLMTSGLNKDKWGEALRVAAFLTNRSPYAEKSATPYENWHNRKPDLSTLKTFGCSAYVKQLNYLKKLDDRSKKLIMIGYAPVGYRMWDEEKRSIIISRDVNFNENEVCGEKLKMDSTIVRVKCDEEEDNSEVKQHSVQADANNTENASADENRELGVPDDLNEDADNFQFLDSSISEAETTMIQDPNWQPGEGDFDTEATESDLDEHLEARPARVYPSRIRAFPERYQAMLTSNDADSEPETYTEALASADAEKWVSSMQSEYDSLIENKTWILVPRPKNHNVIKCRWVYRKKRDENNKVIKFKSRVVAKGYSQKFGIDYTETFAPVVRNSIIRFLLAIAVILKLEIDHIDAKCAFLNADLTETVYMEQPEGMVQKGNERKVCLLKKSLYGLKQASREWYSFVNKILIGLGFKRAVLQVCVYYKIVGNLILIIALFVDDFLVFSNQKDKKNQLISELQGKFNLVFLGPVKHFLGMTIERDTEKNEIRLHQKSYILNLLKKFNMCECNVIATPLEVRPDTQILTKAGAEVLENVPYQNLIGGLMYLVVCTRPDIAHTVSFLSSFNKEPTSESWRAAKRVLRYLKGTLGKSIVYKHTPDSLKLIGFSDADYANDKKDRKSYGGYVFFMANGPISWESKKQKTTALSSCESELIALNEAAKEACYLKNLYDELFGNSQLKITLCSKLETILLTDSQSAKELVENPVFHNKSKHIEVRYYFIREKVAEGKFKLKHVGTSDMVADILTKALPRPSHEKHTNALLH